MDDLNKFLNDYFVYGWRGIAKKLGVSVRTVKRWHYTKCALPFVRVGSLGGNSRISISKCKLDFWLDHLAKMIKAKAPSPIGSRTITRIKVM
jgi:hypothetical protein